MSDEELHAMVRITKRLNNLFYECKNKGDFTIVENIMNKFDPSKLSMGCLVSTLTTMSWARKDVDLYPMFFEKCAAEMRTRPEFEEGHIAGLSPEEKQKSDEMWERFHGET